MEPVTMILSGLVIAIGAGAVGKSLNNNKVKNVTCGERQSACSSLLGNKIDNLADEIKGLKDVVHNLFNN